jgi:hypothetical protein
LVRVLQKMVQKINDEYYLNRAEAISYILQAYHAKWCYARWSRDEVAFSYETKGGERLRFLVPAFKTKSSKTVRVRKFDLDHSFGNQ